MKTSAKKFWAVFAVLGGLLIAFLLFQASLRYSEFSDKLNTISQLKIGMPADEVLYIKGNPKLVGINPPSASPGEDNKLYHPGIDLPQGKSIGDYSYWVWSDNSINLYVTFSKEERKVINVNCDTTGESANLTLCTTINNLSAQRYTVENTLKSTLGEPDNVTFYNDGEARIKIVEYHDYGLIFILQRGLVASIIKNSHTPSFFWWLTHYAFKPDVY